MKSASMNLLCRILVLAMLMLPFQPGYAGTISTEQATQTANAASDRGVILNALNRSETTRQLQSYGVDPQVAKNRVAAMTDEEAGALAGKINAAPAGGDGLVVLILVIFLIWIVVSRR